MMTIDHGAGDDADVRPATPEEASDVRGMHAANRAAWDEAAERYEGWFAEAVDLIRGGGSNLFPVEEDLIGDLRGRCRRAIHLQCAGGRDTLSLWNLGAAEVVGVDFSPRMLDLARRLTEATNAPARWVEADVLDVPHDLDGTADLLYTGRGSLMWLQDLDAWAAVLHRLLAPQGRLVIFEGHPAEWLFDADAAGRWSLTDYDYFGGAEASRGWAPGYIDHLSIPDGEQHWKFARAWTLGEVITALARSGLRLDEVAEHPVDWWAGHRDVRPEERGRLPLSFSVIATRGDVPVAAGPPGDRDDDHPPVSDEDAESPLAPLDPREAARARRRDHDLEAERRDLMRPGMGKVFKQITDSIGRKAPRDQKRARKATRKDA